MTTSVLNTEYGIRGDGRIQLTATKLVMTNDPPNSSKQ
jgi:hypothetical protein